jgi:hypothetical protein
VVASPVNFTVGQGNFCCVPSIPGICRDVQLLDEDTFVLFLLTFDSAEAFQVEFNQQLSSGGEYLNGLHFVEACHGK